MDDENRPAPSTTALYLAQAATQALADGLLQAIVRNDLAAADRIYADDLVVWHNYDGLDCDKPTSLRTISEIHETYSRFWVSDIRRDYLRDGYVQRCVYHAVTNGGENESIPAMMRVWTAAGRITRIEEYTDASNTSAPGPPRRPK